MKTMTSKRYPNLPADAEESARAVSEPQAAGIASAGRRGERGGPRPETEAKYREAVELYVATDLTTRQISERCGVPLGGFRSYLSRFHRELVFARHGVICPEMCIRDRYCQGFFRNPCLYIIPRIGRKNF